MKNLMIIFVALLLAFVSCKKEEIIKETPLQNGIYVGQFNEWSVAYAVNSNEIKPLGYSFPTISTTTINETSFTANFSNDYLPKSTVCFKTAIKETDYETALLNSDKEFCGLHYALNQNDISYHGGPLAFAIKSLPNEKWMITITRLGTDFVYQTEAVMSSDSNPVAHRILTFAVVPEISRGGVEEWTMTLNPITNYQWSNLFSVYTAGISRFQVEVIDNGLE